MNSNNHNQLPKHRGILPPKSLPVYNANEAHKTSYLGWVEYEKNFAKRKVLFGIKRRDLGRNLLIIGRPRTHKSEIMHSLIRQDIANGFGVTVLDYKGNLFNELLQDVTESRLPDLFAFNPSNQSLGLALNPLADLDPNFKIPILRVIQQTIEKMYKPLWSPALEFLVHIVFSTVLSLKNPTLIKAFYLIAKTDQERLEILRSVKSSHLLDFWFREFETWRDKHEQDAVLPLVNILRTITASGLLADIYSENLKQFPLKNPLAEKKLMFFNLDSTTVGETSINFLSEIILARHTEWLQTSQLNENTEHFVYIYGADLPLSNNLKTILFQSRKNPISVIFSTDSTLAITSEQAQEVAGQFDNLIATRLTQEDASRLKGEFLPEFDTRDLQNLGEKEMICRLSINSKISTPFIGQPLAIHPNPSAISQSQVVDYLNEQYGLPTPDIY